MIERRGGLFISFEGTEGSGKSTQMRLLADRLRKHGHPITENQEPGGTAIGKQIRHILLDRENSGMVPMTELLLMFASRAQAVVETIRPALERADIVLSDRFTDSTLAYQGAARGLGFDAVKSLHTFAIGSLWPDLTICPVVDVSEGLQRAQRRNQSVQANEDRLDEQGLAFHNAVLDGYRAIAAAEPERFRLIPGDGSPSEVAERIWEEVRPMLDKSLSR